ncbi:MAG: hypothetical protein ABR973_02720 [Candidatus Acidiferrales bacterium]
MATQNPQTPATVAPSLGPGSPRDAREIWNYLALAFGITWPIEILASLLGTRPGGGEYALSFGIAGPAVAAILLSRRGREAIRASSRRLLWFLALWPVCWTAYVANDRMRFDTPPSSLHYYLAVSVLALIPAGIISGMVSKDIGVRELLHTLIRPQNWRW